MPKSLRLLAEIIDCGSFTRAAEALNVTQPTLTRTIQHLESLTGAPLLKRGRYGVSATKLGEMMAREGRAVRAAVGEAQSALKQWRSGVEGQLRIGVGPMVAHSIMPRFVDHCLEADSNRPAHSLRRRPEHRVRRQGWSARRRPCAGGNPLHAG